MNQPTRDEFEAFKQEVKQQIREQITEEIKATKVIIVSEDALKPISEKLNQQGDLLKRINTKQDKFSTDIDELKLDAKAYIGDAAIFKNKVEHVEADVSTIKTDIEQVKTVQNGHAKFFEEHGKRLAATATKNDVNNRFDKVEGDIAELKGLITQLLQQKSGE